ncbi:MAG: hypothetical protein Q8R28_22245 [Dehalococcoidia bacterium]|nr:hypothetical protein [Dehalococcoidia bacterium]
MERTARTVTIEQFSRNLDQWVQQGLALANQWPLLPTENDIANVARGDPWPVPLPDVVTRLNTWARQVRVLAGRD